MKVFERLNEAKGISALEAPFLVITDGLPNPDFKIAIASDDQVYLDRAVLEIIDDMGADSSKALAFILAHEIAHYIHGHSVRHRYIGLGEKHKWHLY